MILDEPSFTVKIWIAGSYEDACRSVKSFCEEGACFTVTKTSFVYTRGMEDGVVISRINYPRFPSTKENILDQCQRLAEKLLMDLFQDTYCLETPEKTIWKSRKQNDL